MEITDLFALQECLGSYRLLLDWLPCLNQFDKDMKEVRLGEVTHLEEVIERKLNERFIGNKDE